MRPSLTAAAAALILAAALAAAPGARAVAGDVKACLECHGDTARVAQHPNADRVDRGPDQPFTPERCTGCHGSVVDDFAKGEHGGRPADPSADYDRCTGCHNPHEQLRSADAARFDPGRPVQQQCGSCHAQRVRLPEPSRDDDTCLSCHSRYDLNAPGAAGAARTLCLACHGREHAMLHAFIE